jgi:hypothetical protein
LGEAAGLGRVTVPRIEAIGGELGGRSKTREKIRHALESAGVEFIDPNDGGLACGLKSHARKGLKADISRRHISNACILTLRCCKSNR